MTFGVGISSDRRIGLSLRTVMRFLLKSLALTFLCVELCFAHAIQAGTPDASPSPTLWPTLKCDKIVANIKKRDAMTPQQISKLPAPPEDENAHFRACLQVAPAAQSPSLAPPPSPYHITSKTKLAPPPPSPSPSSSVDPPFGPFASFAGAETSACSRRRSYSKSWNAPSGSTANRAASQ